MLLNLEKHIENTENGTKIATKALTSEIFILNKTLKNKNKIESVNIVSIEKLILIRILSSYKLSL